MLSLRTLGGLYVANEDGEPITGAVTQRRVLALLAVLAVAGDRGVTRDKLLAMLWPEADAERARHSLTQAVYSARRALGIEDLFLPGSDLRLNPERVRSDVQELEAAIDSGDLERAARLYQGPFADGFFLAGSAEFEQWSSMQRARLEDRIAGAFARLAERAEATGQAREALEWRKRLAAIRPLDASATVALMNTLASAGDRAGALQHARIHETLLKEQLGLEPDPVVSSLAERLRAPVDWRAESGRLSSQAPAESSPAGGLVEPAATEVPPRIHRWAPLWLVAAAGLTALAGLLGVLLRPRQTSPTMPPPPPPLEQQVVVAPFRVAGASPSLEYLREGLVELLSARLADDSGARSVDAGAVLAAWRAAGIGPSASVSREKTVQLAAMLGAKRVVIGSAVGTRNRVVITAAAVEVPTGTVRGETTVEGPADSISALVDRLAVGLLRLDAGDDMPLASQTTRSPRALRAFLAGQAAFHRGSYSTALRRYEQALGLDSTFALAALQHARAADRLHVVEPRSRSLALAWRDRDALDARARALLMALAGPSFPAPSIAEEQIATWEGLIDLTPDRAEAWYEAGARLLQEGALARAADGTSRGVLALRRVLELEPTHTGARELLAQLADVAALPPSVLADSALPLAPFLQWRLAVSRVDSTPGAPRRGLSELGPRNLRAIALAAQRSAVGLADARRAVQLLRSRAGRPAERVDAALGEHALALNEGRRRDALAATERLAEIQPGSRAHLRLRVLDVVYGDGDQRAAAAAAAALEQSASRRSATDLTARAVQHADACVLAQWRLHHGDTAGVDRAIGLLRGEPLRLAAIAPPVAAGGPACAVLLEAALAVALRRPDAGTAVSRLDSLAFTAAVSADAITYAPLLIARLHARLGNPRAAFEALRRRDPITGWPRYLATSWREEARYANLAGIPGEGRPALARYVALRANPDPELRGQVDEIRRALDGAPVTDTK